MTIGTISLKKPGLRGLMLGGVWALLIAPLVLSVVSRAAITSLPNGPNVLYPVLNVGKVPPLVMLVASRDEQLYIKAYTDYTDLDGDGVVDTTYNNNFGYSGYFDPNLCYAYGSGVFKAAAAATNHQCDGSHYSGNFMNWAAMSRVDVLRYVLYGGNRSTDGTDQTVLERSYIPSDLHAWSKVYAGADTNKYTPYSGTISMCNVSPTTTSEPQLRVAKGAYYNWASTAREQCMWREDAVAAFGTPADLNPNDDASFADDKLDVLTVRVDVCDNSSFRESFCQEYKQTNTDGTITSHWKPVGLLQKYGEKGLLRFGLISGTYNHPRAGGVLRRNIGLFAGNDPTTACDYDPTNGKVDEVNLSTGQFCNQADGDEGIINTLRRFKITSWNPDTQDYGIPAFDTTVTNPDGSKTTTHTPASGDCPTYGILQRDVAGNNGHLLDPDGSGGLTTAFTCKDSGNPLAEMYAEALRYIRGKSADSDYAGASGVGVTGLPQPTWLDPYRDPKKGGNPYCAQCSIVVLTTGLDSFDSDKLPSGLAAIAATNTTQVGTLEGLDTKTQSGSPPKYLVGREGALDSTTYQDVCAPREITDLNLTFGICPEVPSLEGGYQMAGLSYWAWTNDMRPDLTKPTGVKNKVDTYAIALAETLPTFEVPVSTTGGNGSVYDRVSITPACQANNSGNATSSSSGWRSCYLGNLVLGTQTSANLSDSDWKLVISGNAPVSAGTCSPTSSTDPCHVFGLPSASDTHGPTRGSFEVVWEDSQWGNDHDQDLIEMLSFCRGTACLYDGNNNGTPDICEGTASTDCNNPKSIGEQQMLIRTEVLATYAGNAMQTGYTMGGANNSTNQAAFFTVLRPGGGRCPPTGTDKNGNTTYTDCNGSLLFGKFGGAEGWGKPSVEKLTTGPSEQIPLENPLYFAAKYGGFQDQNDNDKPDLQGEWDSKNNFTGAAGADGVPDNYFLVRNPTQLAQSLTNAFNSILQRSGSGTAAAVVANSINGQGVVYKATYQPLLSDKDGNSVAWTGTLNTLWVDSDGLLREDNNSNHKLDGYDTDKIVVYTSDASDNNKPEFNECTPTDITTFNPSTYANGTDTGQVTCVLHTDVADLKTVWDAQKQLMSSDNTFGASQRTYSSATSGGRYMFTWTDSNHDGVVESGEQTPFVWNGTTTTSGGFFGTDTYSVPKNNGGSTSTTVDDSSSCPPSAGATLTAVNGNLGLLNTDCPQEAKNIVNWIRGVEVSGLRSRMINRQSIDGTSGTCDLEGKTGTSGCVIARLGDIVNSTPLVIGKPAEAFDQLYGDSSYATFRAQYRDRRQVVYVGANDGMLHAFNGGFYDAANHQLDLQPQKCDSTGCASDTSFTAHPLGGEIWAYVPGDLLPTLRWLTAANYAHGFYVDGSPVATDAKIFANDTTADGPCAGAASGAICHPGGWGTVLVVPFRLGGGASGGQADVKVPVPIDNSKGYNPGACTTDNNCQYEESYSSYVVLDVTDPEKAPKLLAELHPASDDGHGSSFTTSEPAFAVIRNPTSSVPDNFYLFIGSGPTLATQDKVTSTAPLRVYGYDMAAIACKAGDGSTGCTASAAPLKSFDLSNKGVVAEGKNSFAGDLIASDFNLNDKAEAVYFGSVRDDQTSTPREYTGSLWKLTLGVDATTKKAAGESTDSSTWATAMIYDAKKPIVIRPTLGLNLRLAPEIYAATGRVLDSTDLTTKGQQQIFSMIDPDLLPSGDAQSDFTLPLSSGDLLDVTNIGVCAEVVTSTCAAVGDVVGGSTGVSNFNDLQQLFATCKTANVTTGCAGGGKAGFVLNLASSSTAPAQRVVSAQTLLGGVLITNAYTPDTNTCTDLGTGQEFSLNFITGTNDPGSSTFGTNDNGTGKTSVSLGAGLPSPPSLHVSAGSDASFSSVTACTQTSTGAIVCQPVTTLFPVRSSEISWREPLDQ